MKSRRRGKFCDVIKNEFSDDIEKRVDGINQKFTFSLFTNVCRSLFERHKLHFAFLVCARIRMRDNLIDATEWRHFLAGPEPFEVRSIKLSSNRSPIVTEYRDATEIYFHKS